MKYCTGLNETGRRELAAWLAANLSDKALAVLLSAWQSDVDTSDNPGHIEIPGRDSRTGNPITTTISANGLDYEEDAE